MTIDEADPSLYGNDMNESMKQHLITTDNPIDRDSEDCQQHNQSMWIKDHKTDAKDNAHNSLYVQNPQLKKQNTLRPKKNHSSIRQTLKPLGTPSQ